MVRVGAVLPTRELPAHPDPIREWLEAATDIGVDHVILADHVVGVDPERREDWAAHWPHPAGFRAAYTVNDVFHEPFVLFGYLAALCDLELVTGVLILPQRQTALVAKQAAEVDVLCRGRLRLAVGVGWNAAEYEVLGERFDQRGARIEEQIAVLRRLWTEDVVDFDGRFHRLTGVGVRPLPVQRPIPLWLGGEAPSVLRRIGRVGDGWYLHGRAAPDEAFRAQLTHVHTAAEASGRAVEAIGIEARFRTEHQSDSELQNLARAWGRAGATHLAVDTMNAGRTTVVEHVDALRRGVSLARG